MNELLKAVESLISDIESMQSTGRKNSPWFGPFSEFNYDMNMEDGVNVEWPNLAISTDKVKEALAVVRRTTQGDQK